MYLGCQRYQLILVKDLELLVIIAQMFKRTTQPDGTNGKIHLRIKQTTLDWTREKLST
jgi:hypothetical protein